MLLYFRCINPGWNLTACFQNRKIKIQREGAQWYPLPLHQNYYIAVGNQYLDLALIR